MRAFTDLLPLRTTAVWGQYREAAVIPHRYGTTAGPPLQYDSARRLFVWADHPSLVVSEVRVGGQLVLDWRWYNGADSTGRGVTFVQFGQPVDEGAEILISGTGKAHARTGAALENPADVLHDILANIAGMSVAESDLDVFRAQAATLGLKVAGSIDERVSVQTPCVALCESVGAVFCATMPGFARVFPGDLDAYVSVAVEGKHAVSADAELDDLANVLTVHYDFADGNARRSLRLEAPDSIADFGQRELEIEAHWLANGRVAYEMAARRITHSARPRYRISAAGLAGRIRVGETVSFDHPRLPYSGTAFVTSVVLDVPALKSSAIEAVVAVGDAPRISLVSQASAFEPDRYASAALVTRGSERIVTIEDEIGQPVGNAKVVLDGEVTRFTDASGRVTFPIHLMPPGEHELVVTAGERELVMVVTV